MAQPIWPLYLFTFALLIGGCATNHPPMRRDHPQQRPQQKEPTSSPALENIDTTFCGQFFRAATHVIRCDSSYVSDLAPLTHLTELQDLTLISTQVSDLSPLANLSELSTIVISGSRVSNLAPLHRLQELEVLSLSKMPVSDLEPLRGLPLEVLVLEHLPISDLSPVADIGSLRDFSAIHTQATSIGGLTDARKLRVLNLAGSPIKSIQAAGRFTDLRSLNLDRTEVSDLRPLLALRNLRHLYVRETKATTEMIDHVEAVLPGLTVYR